MNSLTQGRLHDHQGHITVGGTLQCYSEVWKYVFHLIRHLFKDGTVADVSRFHLALADIKWDAVEQMSKPCILG